MTWEHGQRAMAVHLGAAWILLALSVLSVRAQQGESGGGGGGGLSPPVTGPVPHQVSYVSTGEQLLDALNRTNVDVIYIMNDVTVTEAHMRAFKLPLIKDPDKNIYIASALGGDKAQRATLDFGGALQLLWLKPPGKLTFKRLDIKGIAPASESAQAGLTTTMPDWSPLWPTIAGDDAHWATFEDVTMERIRPGDCSPEVIDSSSRELERLLNTTQLSWQGTTLHWDGSVVSALPILNIATNAQVGKAFFNYTNVTITCLDGVGQLAPVPPEGGASSHTWVYILVGVLGGLAVLSVTAGGFLLLRRQRRRKTAAVAALAEADVEKHGRGEEEEEQQQQPLALVVAPTAAERASKEGAPPTPGQGPMLRQLSSETMSGVGVGGLGASSVWTTRVGPISGLELGEAIGRGSYGTVYKGRWKSSVVAVKVVEQYIGSSDASRLAREPLLSVSLSHPQVVTTFRLAVTCVRPDDPISQPALNDLAQLPPRADAGSSGLTGSAAVLPQQSGGSSGGLLWLHQLHQEDGAASTAESGRQPAGSGQVQVTPDQLAPSVVKHKGLDSDTSSIEALVASAAAADETWAPDGIPSSPGWWRTLLVMEYCDLGSLTAAILGGQFLKPNTQQLDMVALLLTLLEVAQGMEYIHDLNLIHGDLKGRNVLLKSARIDRRGFTSKIVDFGLTRMLGHAQTHVRTCSYGTLSHAAPELLGEGRASKASDVYAYSIIMWEMAAGQEAYSDLTGVQLIARIACTPTFRPDIPPSCPPALAGLMQRCWHINPRDRPSFAEIVQELRSQLQALKRQDSAKTASPTGSVKGAAEQEAAS